MTNSMTPEDQAKRYISAALPELYDVIDAAIGSCAVSPEATERQLMKALGLLVRTTRAYGTACEGLGVPGSGADPDDVALEERTVDVQRYSPLQLGLYVRGQFTRADNELLLAQPLMGDVVRLLMSHAIKQPDTTELLGHAVRFWRAVEAHIGNAAPFRDDVETLADDATVSATDVGESALHGERAARDSFDRRRARSRAATAQRQEEGEDQ